MQSFRRAWPSPVIPSASMAIPCHPEERSDEGSALSPIKCRSLASLVMTKVVRRYSGTAIDAALELRVRALDVGHGEIHVRAVVAALVVLAARENLVLRSPVLSDQSAQVTQTLTTTEGPERLLAEEQRDRFRLRRRGGQWSHRCRLEGANLRRRRAERVHDRHHPRNVVVVQRRLGFNQARVDPGNHWLLVIAVLPDLLNEEWRRSILGREAC